MEQKRVLTFPNGEVVLPHIIDYLKLLKVEVKPKDKDLDRSEAIFNIDDLELKPKQTSQNDWWLQTPDGVADEHTIRVSGNQIIFEMIETEDKIKRNKHVCLGLYEKEANGFSITTTVSDLESSISSVIKVTSNQVNGVRIDIKPFGSDCFNCYDIAGGENIGQAAEIIEYIIKGYEEQLDPDDFNDLLFLEMLKDCRLHNGIKAYINRTYKSEEDLEAAFNAEIAMIEQNRAAIHQAVDYKCDAAISALTAEYEKTRANMSRADWCLFGVIESKKSK